MARTDYEMFSPSGNARVAEMVNGIIADIRAGNLARRDLETAISQGCERISKMPREIGDEDAWGEPLSLKNYGEVYDTEPQGDIAEAISIECEAQGWKPVSRWDW